MSLKEFGPYRLDSLVGSGGMGEVYAAFDTRRQRVVALKLLPEVLCKDEEYQRRFRHESHVAARLREPHVIPIHDYGEIDERLYIDMRLVDGDNIARLLTAHGPFEPARAAHVISQVAEALDAAHSDGLVHRDIKPTNVLVTRNDFVYVVDFGIAHAVGSEGTALTMTGATIGSLDYMAPERFQSRPVDLRIDVYSLTCLLYECLTAQKPYTGHDLATLMYAHLAAPAPSPSQVRPGVPESFDAVIARGMAKDPDLRFSSPGELADAARAALGGSQAPAAVPAAPPPETLTAADFSPTQAHPTPASGPQPPAAEPGRPAAAVSGPAPAVGANGDGPVGAVTVNYGAPPPPPRPPTHTGPGALPLPPPPPGRRRRLAVVLAGVTILAVLGLLVAFAVNRLVTQTAGAANPAAVAPPLTPTAAASLDVPTIGQTFGVSPKSGFVTVAPNGRYAYVANRDQKTISAVDTTANSVTATIAVDAGPPWFIAFAPNGQKAYVSIYIQNTDLNLMAVLDTTSNKITATVPVAKRPFALSVTPDGQRVYVPGHDEGALSLVDTNSSSVIQTIPVPPNPHWVTLTADGSRAYLANHESNLVSVLDTATNTVVKTIPTGISPHSVAISPDGATVHATNYDGNTVSVIETATNTVRATIPVGNHPQSVAFARDGKHSYVANVDSDNISVINTETNKVTATLPVGDAPTSVAVLPDGGRAYVTNLNDGTITVLDIAG